MSGPNLAMMAQMDTAALRGIPEHDFSVAVVAVARAEGWEAHYERRSGHVGQDGQWRGSGPKGKPDLTLARAGNVLLAELKKEDGVVSPKQRAWLAAAGDHGRLWRPRDAATIMKELA